LHACFARCYGEDTFEQRECAIFAVAQAAKHPVSEHDPRRRLRGCRRMFCAWISFVFCIDCNQYLRLRKLCRKHVHELPGIVLVHLRHPVQTGVKSVLACARTGRRARCTALDVLQPNNFVRPNLRRVADSTDRDRTQRPAARHILCRIRLRFQLLRAVGFVSTLIRRNREGQQHDHSLLQLRADERCGRGTLDTTGEWR